MFIPLWEHLQNVLRLKKTAAWKYFKISPLGLDGKKNETIMDIYIFE